MTSVPVIDIAQFDSGSADEQRRIADSVGTACEEIGFLVVTGHGVAPGVIDDLYAVAMEFFQLPFEHKREVRSPVNNLYQGYAHPGPNPGDHTSERQSYNVFRYDTVAEAVANGYPPDLEGLFFDALWPREPAGFRNAVRTYYAEMERLAGRLLTILESTLGTDPQRLTSMLDHHLSTQAINYYSDDIDSGHERTPYRFKAHHDGSLLTILYQDDGPGSLQLHRRGSGWMDVAPIPDTFVVNTGEILTRLTNGRYPATPHRVLHPPADAPKVPRMSAPFFFKPGLDSVLAPMPELLSADEESRYDPHTGRSWYTLNQRNIDNGYDSTKQYEALAADGVLPA
ncbi:MAG: isopenicillin N synthase family dioxygenase [Ilumatobacter sp.]|jgi:isopenicillin N synthase-like dioxygenase|uniref:isopenicillin N synthase family dioxygenase n=1 Tax=Ilumatobacter sp. TaxID=1967498 RepID=UPI00391A20E1